MDNPLEIAKQRQAYSELCRQALVEHASACRQARSKGESLPSYNGPELLALDSRGDRMPLNLQGANLAGINLDFMNLRNANFCGVSLRDATLRNVILWDSVFSSVDLEGADLTGVDFTGSYISSVNMKREQAQTMDFTGATCFEVRFW